MKADDLKRQWKDACDYIAKHGAPEPHFRRGSVGRLHKVDVETEICHQASPGAQSYWKSSYFDAALDEVIKRRFPELAAEALAYLKKKYEDALRAEKDQLLALLAEIQAIEEAQ